MWTYCRTKLVFPVPTCRATQRQADRSERGASWWRSISSRARGDRSSGPCSGCKPPRTQREPLGWAQAYVQSAGELVGPPPPAQTPRPAASPPRRAQFPSLDPTEASGLGQCAHLAHHKHLVEELVRLAAVVRHPRPSAGSPRIVSAAGFRAAAAPQSSARKCQDRPLSVPGKRFQSLVPRPAEGLGSDGRSRVARLSVTLMVPLRAYRNEEG